MKPMTPWLLVLLLGFGASMAAASAPSSPRMPLFRPPNASEASAAAAAGAPIAWSAHRRRDDVRVVSDDAPVVLVCLLDGIDGSGFELSWTVEDVDAGAMTRHTLTAQANSGQSQTFSLDLGPGLAPATGQFDHQRGSLLTVAFPRPASRPLMVGCDLRLGGAIVAASARLRFWDERPAAAALAASGAGGLDCRLARHRLAAPLALSALRLDCAPPAPPPGASAVTWRRQLPLFLETAVYSVSSVASLGRRLLASNSTDPAAFFAAYLAGRLLLGWTTDAADGNGAELERVALASGSGDGLQLDVVAALPSGLERRLQLHWQLRIDSASATNTKALDNDNVTSKDSAKLTDHRLLSFGVSQDGGGVTEIGVDVDHFLDPPVPRALFCPYLCPVALSGTPQCRFLWLRAKSGAPPGGFKPPGPSRGSLNRVHALWLLPWQPAGNPGPPPLAGDWTCRSEALLQQQPPPPLSLLFRVRVVARPTFCGAEMPPRSVVFVATAAASNVSRIATPTSLTVGCSLCGLDAATAPQLGVHGSLGGVVAHTQPATSRRLPGGGLELRLRFSRLIGAGSVLLRCRAVDSRGLGAVAFATVEALPVPPAAVVQVDCRGGCFRCPLDLRLKAALQRLRPLLEAAYLFELQPRSTQLPPQLVSGSSDQVSTERGSLARLRCTQLVFYADSAPLRQQELLTTAARAATHRAALGDTRYRGLVLALTSSWLELEPDVSASRPRTQSAYVQPGYVQQPETSWVDYVDVVVGVILVIILVAGIGLAFWYRERLCSQRFGSKAARAPPVAAVEGGSGGGGGRRSTGSNGLKIKKKKKKKKKTKKKGSNGAGQVKKKKLAGGPESLNNMATFATVWRPAMAPRPPGLIQRAIAVLMGTLSSTQPSSPALVAPNSGCWSVTIDSSTSAAAVTLLPSSPIEDVSTDTARQSGSDSPVVCPQLVSSAAVPGDSPWGSSDRLDGSGTGATLSSQIALPPREPLPPLRLSPGVVGTGLRVLLTAASAAEAIVVGSSTDVKELRAPPSPDAGRTSYHAGCDLLKPRRRPAPIRVAAACARLDEPSTSTATSTTSSKVPTPSTDEFDLPSSEASPLCLAANAAAAMDSMVAAFDLTESEQPLGDKDDSATERTMSCSGYECELPATSLSIFVEATESRCQWRLKDETSLEVSWKSENVSETAIVQQAVRSAMEKMTGELARHDRTT